MEKPFSSIPTDSSEVGFPPHPGQAQLQEVGIQRRVLARFWDSNGSHHCSGNPAGVTWEFPILMHHLLWKPQGLRSLGMTPPQIGFEFFRRRKENDRIQLG